MNESRLDATVWVLPSFEDSRGVPFRVGSGGSARGIAAAGGPARDDEDALTRLRTAARFPDPPA